ncbi:actin [Podila horticola]|nr:actin [Podila horticola]
MNRFHVSPDEQPVLVTETALNPNKNREMTTEICFETYGVPAFNIEKRAMLLLFAAGCTTGLAVQSGEYVTEVVPMVDGVILTEVQVSELAGRTVTDLLAKKLNARGMAVGLETARDIKERCCFVSGDLKKEDGTVSKDYKLPDGQVVHIGTECFEVTEVLFDPNLLDLSVDGMHKMIRSSLNKLKDDDRKDLTNSISLSGGNTMYDGIVARLKAELSQFGIVAKIKAPAERKHSAWIGGSIRAALAAYQHHWVTHEEYNEHGASIINTKKF